MSDFSQFLYTRRKALGLTQQNIADRLNITNKAVSKWEAGECSPETSQLVALADVLECTMDELLRGRFAEKHPNEQMHEEVISSSISAEQTTENLQTSPKGVEERRQPKPWQTVFIGMGVALVLLGVVGMLLLLAFMEEGDKPELWGMILLFSFLAAATFFFVFAGISYSVTDRVEEEKKPRARLFAAGMGISIFFIVASGICFPVGLMAESSAGGAWLICTAVMLSVIAVAIVPVILCGVGIARLGLPSEGKEEPWSGIIMMAAVIIFLVCGFVWNAWHPAWIVFPIGGILCGAVELIRKIFKK